MSSYTDRIDLKTLIGKTLTKVENENDEKIIFTVNNKEKYALLHLQNCCESVLVDDICGDLQDLVGNPILQAEENSSDDRS